jgi:exodeoxyribonuclease VII large subunit
MSSIPQSNREILSVADLNRAARQLLESEFAMLYVEGEISNFARPSSGHWYFTLKDSSAQIRCAMFRNRNQAIRFTPANGQQVILRGKISLYEGRGEYQLIAEFLEEAGDGALRRAFDKLKAQLQAEGLFAADTKRPIPKLPEHLCIITSPTGAAVRDVLQVMGRRFPGINITILPVAVQGDDSPAQIVRALTLANDYTGTDQDKPFDVILLTRGGGSLEDLWSFNTEPVARAIHASRLPVVSAVGHETDVSIADFVADLRAPTPSAAAELISPDASEWLQAFKRYDRLLLNQMSAVVGQQRRNLQHLSQRMRHPGQRLQDFHQRLDDLELRLRGSFRHYLGQFRVPEYQARLVRAVQRQTERARARLTLASAGIQEPDKIISQHQQRVSYLGQRLTRQMHQTMEQRSGQLAHSADKLNTVSPLATLQRGYAIVSRAGAGTQIVRDASSLAVGDLVDTRLKQGQFEARVTAITLPDNTAADKQSNTTPGSGETK